MKKYNKPQVFPIRAQKSLGQHFLCDDAVVNDIVTLINELRVNHQVNNIVEIGPGTGVLTKPLLESQCIIHAIEKDERAYELLKTTLGQSFSENFILENTDVLKSFIKDNPQKRLCVGNLPYYITSDILLWLCDNTRHFCASVFMVQNEVADRLVAKISTKDYGRLTVRMQSFFKIKKHFIVYADSFSPPPSVDSAIISLEPTDFAFSSIEEEKFYDRFTAMLFSSRRKMLRKAMSAFLNEQESVHLGITAAFWKLAAELNISEELRPDATPREAIIAFYKFFWAYNVI